MNSYLGLLIIRTYALYDRNKVVLWITSGVAFLGVAVGCVSISSISVGLLVCLNVISVGRSRKARLSPRRTFDCRMQQ